MEGSNCRWRLAFVCGGEQKQVEGSFGLWRAVMISEVKISHMEGSFDMWREQSLVWGGR